MYSEPLSLVSDIQILADQGVWKIDIIKGDNAGNTGIYWTSHINTVNTINSYSQGIVLKPEEYIYVDYNINGPTTYNLGSTGTKVQFTQIELGSSSKTFVIDHPKDTEKYLVHACLEGPEAGVYYRGKNIIQEGREVTIDLPDYVSELADDFTVHITPIHVKGSFVKRILSVSEVENNSFTVYGEPGPFNWIVYGRRQIVITEPYKSQVEVKGEGPYKFI